MEILAEKKRMRKLQHNGFVLLLFVAVFAFFLFAGREGAVLFDDSDSYMWLHWREGVMPFYPLFLLLNQWIFDMGAYLWIVVVEQSFLAAFSIVLLTETVRRRAHLYYVEGVLFALLLLYPYTIEMPTAVMTQAILTEGVAYSFFYIFLTVLLEAVWQKSYGWLCGAFGMTVLLTMLRSQLQILFLVCGIVFCYLFCMRRRKEGKGQKALRFSGGIAGCLAVSLLGITLAAGMVRGYKTVVQQNEGFSSFVKQVQETKVPQAILEEAQEREAKADEKVPAVKQGLKINQNFASSQYMTLIFSRGMYEADPEDAALFEDEVLRGLYLALYDVVDANEERYAYAEEGLWMWKHIVGSIGKIGISCIWTPSEYYAEYAPQIDQSPDFSTIRHDHMMAIGLTLITAHFGRFLYHTLMLLPQAFISTVFFQYAPLYLRCHLVTAFLYLSAAALMIWGYADQRAGKEAAEMMALVLGTNVVMVVIISLVFFGQQRYLVYAFGPFYIAYYLLLRQLWRLRIRGFLHGRKMQGSGYHTGI